jgi:hypothetical protein
MSENKNAKTPADGPDYERGFVDGMQRQMRLSISKIFGPNLEEILNHAGFYEKREWVGLTDEEIDAAWRSVDYKVDYYHCVICGKFIEAVDGVIVHDDIPHPPLMDFDEESNPQ